MIASTLPPPPCSRLPRTCAACASLLAVALAEPATRAARRATRRPSRRREGRRKAKPRREGRAAARQGSAQRRAPQRAQAARRAQPHRRPAARRRPGTPARRRADAAGRGAGRSAGAPATPRRTPAPELKPFETGIDYKPTSPRTLVTFNLEDASLTDLVRLISQITGKRFICPARRAASKPPSTRRRRSPRPRRTRRSSRSSSSTAWRSCRPAATSRSSSRAASRAGRSRCTRGDESVPDRRPLRHAPAAREQHLGRRRGDAARAFKSGDGDITAYAPTNMLIITDTGTNIRRMMRILEEIDVARDRRADLGRAGAPRERDRGRRAPERDLRPGGGKGGSAGQKPRRPSRGKRRPAGRRSRARPSARAAANPLTKIIADERTNSLIIVATERAYLRMLELLKYLDVPMEGEGEIHVLPLQHATPTSSRRRCIADHGRGAAAAAARRARRAQRRRRRRRRPPTSSKARSRSPPQGHATRSSSPRRCATTPRCAPSSTGSTRRAGRSSSRR